MESYYFDISIKEEGRTVKTALMKQPFRFVGDKTMHAPSILHPNLVNQTIPMVGMIGF